MRGNISSSSWSTTYSRFQSLSAREHFGVVDGDVVGRFSIPSYKGALIDGSGKDGQNHFNPLVQGSIKAIRCSIFTLDFSIPSCKGTFRFWSAELTRAYFQSLHAREHFLQIYDEFTDNVFNPFVRGSILGDTFGNRVRRFSIPSCKGALPLPILRVCRGLFNPFVQGSIWNQFSYVGIEPFSIPSCKGAFHHFAKPSSALMFQSLRAREH